MPLATHYKNDIILLVIQCTMIVCHTFYILALLNKIQNYRSIDCCVGSLHGAALWRDTTQAQLGRGGDATDGRAQYRVVMNSGELPIGALCQSVAVRLDSTSVVCAMYACTWFNLKGKL